MIISNDKKVVAYNGDYKPVNIYSGRTKVAGYTTEEFNGKHIEVEDTYNDVLDVAVQGHHEQDSKYAIFWNQLIGGDYTIEDTHKYLVKRDSGESSIVLGSDFKVFPKVHSLPDEYQDVESVSQLFDLTAMFGAGHEPTDEQFRQMFPYDYYPYCDGEWRYAPEEADTAFTTPMPELPEEIVAMENPKVEVSSKGVMWNQIIKNGDFATQTGWMAYNATNSQISITNNTLIHTMKTAGTGGFVHGLSTSAISPRPDKGTKFLISYEVKPSKTVNMGFDVCNTAQSKSISCEAGVWNRCMFRLSAAGTSGGVNIIVRSATSVGDTFIYRNVNLFNLTAMFGAGNEPTTVGEFHAMFPKDYYPYDAGTLRTIKGLHPIVPTITEIPFKLYGYNGVNDTCEPCVLVNGEWKCRVTRRWTKHKLTGGLKQNSTTSKKIFVAYYVFPNNVNRSKGVFVDKFRNGKKNINNGNTWEFGVSNGASSVVYFYFPSSDFDTIKKVNDWVKEHEINVLIALNNPVVNLYDPIPVRTLPINTIIDCDAEMRAKIKRVDNA